MESKSNHLAKRSNESNAIVKQSYSALDSKKKLGQMLDLAAKMTNYELLPGETELWKIALSEQPAERIEHAFQQYLIRARFFPKLIDIIEIMRLEMQRERDQAEFEARRRDREQIQQAREQGECFGIAEVVDQFKKIIAQKKLPDLEPGRKQELLEKLNTLRRKSA